MGSLSFSGNLRTLRIGGAYHQTRRIHRGHGATTRYLRGRRAWLERSPSDAENSDGDVDDGIDETRDEEVRSIIEQTRRVTDDLRRTHLER